MSKIKKNLMYVYGSTAVNGLLGLIFVPIALKNIGVEGYGLYSIFITLTGFIVLAELGFNKYFTRLLSSNRDEKDQKINLQVSVGFYIYVYIVLIVILAPILIYIIPNYIFPIDGKHNIVRIIVACAILDYLFTIPTSLLKTYSISNEKFNKLSRFNLSTGLWRYSLLIITSILFKSAVILVIVILLRRIIEFFYGLKVFGNLPSGSWKPVFKKGLYRKILRDSIYLSVSQLFQMSVTAVGSVLVNRYFGVHSLGIYRSSFDIANKVWFISNGLGVVIFPKFSKMLNDNKENLSLRLSKYLNLSWIIYSIVFLLGLLTIPFYNNLLDIKSKEMFLLLLLGVCYNAHSNLGFEYLQALGKFKTVASINIISFLVIVLSFFILSEELGFLSIGYSWIISQIFYSIITDLLVIWNLKIRAKLLNIFIKLGLFLISILIYTLYI
ncbi:oligosaccharide flippase family protein [Priestia filamentosa]|uniref:oligosaccharide flippase family protein n=1 Tax=Priestia filamentosa TaxID=1402861 RepID=UPI00234BE83A|nr:oligosaccharide flippase family protein [Priestia filamentosa]WCM14576.1 oligosaccharide flippase family protein [Priestia filamentosa]